MYKLINIKHWGKEVNLDIYDIFYVGQNYVIVKFKDSCFMRKFSLADGYEVKTEKMGF